MPIPACLHGPAFSLTGNTLLFSTAVDFSVEFNSVDDGLQVISYEWFLDGSLLIEENGRQFVSNVESGKHEVGVRILSATGWSGIKHLIFYSDVTFGSLTIQGPDSLHEGESAAYNLTLSLNDGAILNVTTHATFAVSSGGSFIGNILTTSIDSDLNDKNVTITATLSEGNTAFKEITILNITIGHPSMVIVEFYDDISLNVIGFVDNVGVSENHVPAYTGQNIIPNGAVAAGAIVLASDLGPNAVKWRFIFNIIKLISQYPNINDFVFEVKGRSNAYGTLTGFFTLRTYDAVMVMTGNQGSYMPSVVGGDVISSGGFSTQVVGGANGNYSEANLKTLIRFNFNVPTDTLTYTFPEKTYVWGRIFEEDPVNIGGVVYAYFVLRTFIGGTATSPPSDLLQPYPCTNPSIGVAYREDGFNTDNNFNVAMNGETFRTCIPPGNSGPAGNRAMVYCPGCGTNGADLNLWLHFQGKAENEWALLQTI